MNAKGNVNYSTYGVMYNWSAALSACPSGWHLPSDKEWSIMEKQLGMSDSDVNSAGQRNSGDVGGKLKEEGTSHWKSPNFGSNNSSFFRLSFRVAADVAKGALPV